MKSCVIYDSAFGNTKTVAQTIAAALNAQLLPVQAVKKADLEGVELLIVGSPINGWMPLPTITNFLQSLKPGELKGVKASAFDTRVKLFIHGDAKNKIAASLKKAGATIAAPPAAFYVQGTKGPLLAGELDRAKAWAASIKSL